MQRIAPLVLVLCLLLPTGAAWSVDGVWEINQTCAVQTGCFAGDAAGFPVTIATRGASVRLTSALTVPDENTHGIQISAEDVSVDLNGFAILGPTVCSGSPTVTSCAPTGTGNGIDASFPGLTVTNGTIQGMGNRGVLASAHSRVSEVHVTSNGETGIWAYDGSIVERCRAMTNGAIGISSALSVVRDNAVLGNVIGINSVTDTILGNTIQYNGNVGIHSLGGSTTGYGHNQINNNNGGNANPQVGGLGSLFEVAPNVCGGDLVCP